MGKTVERSSEQHDFRRVIVHFANYACVVSSVHAEVLPVPDRLVIINYSANHVCVYYYYIHV